MNEASLLSLCSVAAVVGLTHTLVGPDHYLPFVAMARARGWSFTRTLIITIACGTGHVAGSVALGLLGIVAGTALFRLERIESWRGEAAGWLLLAFGAAYTIWGVRRALRGRPHTHWHRHEDGTFHSHEHIHEGDHLHVHDEAPVAAGPDATSVTPWVLFTIFVLGPCEPLIPVLMYPAAKGSLWGVFMVASVFFIATVVTMTMLVALLLTGLQTMHFPRLERSGHAIAGLTIFGCGAAIQLGL